MRGLKFWYPLVARLCTQHLKKNYFQNQNHSALVSFVSTFPTPNNSRSPIFNHCHRHRHRHRHPFFRLPFLPPSISIPDLLSPVHHRTDAPPSPTFFIPPLTHQPLPLFPPSISSLLPPTHKPNPPPSPIFPVQPTSLSPTLNLTHFNPQSLFNLQPLPPNIQTTTPPYSLHYNTNSTEHHSTAITLSSPSSSTHLLPFLTPPTSPPSTFPQPPSTTAALLFSTPFHHHQTPQTRRQSIDLLFFLPHHSAPHKHHPG